MKITLLFDLFGDQRDLLAVLFFLFNGLHLKEHTLDILPLNAIHKASGDILLLERGEGELLLHRGRENLAFLEERGQEYTILLPSIGERYSFSLGPYLDFLKGFELQKENLTPLRILIFYLVEAEELLQESLMAMEMISGSLPPFSLHLICSREVPDPKTYLPIKKFQIFQLSPQALYQEYTRASLCIGLVPKVFFLHEVMACKTPVISIEGDFHPQILNVKGEARDIAVTSLKILKLGQLASRMVRSGRSLIQGYDASEHLHQIEKLFLEYKKRITPPQGEDGDGEGSFSTGEGDQLEKDLIHSSFVLKRALLQVLDFFQGKKRGPF